MLHGWLDLETVTFLTLCPVFAVLEWLAPARPVRRWRQLPVDLIAFFVLLPAGKAIQIALTAGMNAAGLDRTASVLSALRGLSPIPKVLLGLVLVDLALYWMHRWLHSSVLWRAHKWHHSIEHLYWFSGFRASLVQLALNAVPQFVIPVVILHATPLQVGIGFSVGLFFQLWIHANLPISLGVLRHVFVSPAFHRVHHSTARAHRDKNFGGFFTVWDRMFGTFVDPLRTRADFAIGIDGDHSAARMLVGV